VVQWQQAPEFLRLDVAPARNLRKRHTQLMWSGQRKWQAGSKDFSSYGLAGLSRKATSRITLTTGRRTSMSRSKDEGEAKRELWWCPPPLQNVHRLGRKVIAWDFPSEKYCRKSLLKTTNCNSSYTVGVRILL
jgi:hypothetical protein